MSVDLNYVISEIGRTIGNLERLLRGLEQERDKSSDGEGPPLEIEYDRELLREPPRAVEQSKQSQPAPRQNANGEYLELDVDSLHVTDDGGRKTFKVKGGAYRKWGVFIWPEVLERDFGIDSDNIKPGLHAFKYRVRILMDGDKPKKVVGIAQ